MIKIMLSEKISENDYSKSIKGIAYKVFQVQNGKLYPPMVYNLNKNDTPTGVWLDAEEGEFIELDGVKRVIQKGGNREKLLQRIADLDKLPPAERKKALQSIKNSSTLAYRPGWHLGDEPRATQFNRSYSWNFLDDADEQEVVATIPTYSMFRDKCVNGKSVGNIYYIEELGKYAEIIYEKDTFFPFNFVWAECEYVMDVNYQEEAHQAGMGDRQVSYKVLPDVVSDFDGNDYHILQFKQGNNIFNITYSDSGDIHIDGYPFDELEQDYENSDYVKNEVRNYFLQDNLDVIKKIIASGSKKGKETLGVFSHKSGDLKHLPIGGYYKYRTNPDPNTVPWVITGAIKVNRLIDDFEAQRLSKQPISPRQGGNLTFRELEELLGIHQI